MIIPALLLAAALTAGAPNTLTPEEKAGGWQLLFDGSTFAGWDDPTTKTPASNAWVIEDGCLKASPDLRWNEYLFTKDSYRNFELSFEWRVSPGANSGVKYLIQRRELHAGGKRIDRSEWKPGMHAEEGVSGFEYQLIDDHRHADAKDPEHRTGALYDLAPPSAAAAHPVGEFNQSRLVVNNGHFEHWLNGVKVIAVDLESDEFQALLKQRWTKRRPGSLGLLSHPAQLATPLALQNHGDGSVWFRNLKIRRLD